MIIQKEQIDPDNTNQKTKRNITTNITWLYVTIINYRTMNMNTNINHTGFCLHLRGFLPRNANLNTQTGIYVDYSESKYRLRISFAHPPDCHFAHVQ